MTTRQLTKILNQIQLPSYFNKKGKLGYYTVSKNNYVILIGIYLNRATDKDTFFIEHFIQPLFFPFHTFTFSFGERIGNYWKEGDVVKIEKELSQLKQLTSFDEIKNVIKTQFSGVDKEYFHQSVSFINYIQGDIHKAKIEIQKIIKEGNKDLPKWREDEIKKSKEILHLIERGELDLALKEWQKLTINDLRLDKQLC